MHCVTSTSDHFSRHVFSRIKHILNLDNDIVYGIRNVVVNKLCCNNCESLSRSISIRPFHDSKFSDLVILLERTSLNSHFIVVKRNIYQNICNICFVFTITYMHMYIELVYMLMSRSINDMREMSDANGIRCFGRRVWTSCFRLLVVSTIKGESELCTMIILLNLWICAIVFALLVCLIS